MLDSPRDRVRVLSRIADRIVAGEGWEIASIARLVSACSRAGKACRKGPGAGPYCPATLRSPAGGRDPGPRSGRRTYRSVGERPARGPFLLGEPIEQGTVERLMLQFVGNARRVFGGDAIVAFFREQLVSNQYHSILQRGYRQRDIDGRGITAIQLPSIESCAASRYPMAPRYNQAKPALERESAGDYRPFRTRG